MTASCTRSQLGTIVAMVALLVLTACGSDATQAAVTTISADDAAALLADAPDEVVIIDVRTPEEYDAGHLDGAELLDLSGGVFEQRIGSYDRDATYVLYCRTGNRSAQAALMMDELGFTDVRDAGGFDDLAAAGVPLGQ